jgi:hypothetical protein
MQAMAIVEVEASLGPGHMEDMYGTLLGRYLHVLTATRLVHVAQQPGAAGPGAGPAGGQDGVGMVSLWRACISTVAYWLHARWHLRLATAP